MIDPFRERLYARKDLDPARSAPDQGHPFAGQVIRGIVCSRVNELSLETVQVGDGGPAPVVQEAGGGADDVCGVGELLTSSV